MPRLFAHRTENRRRDNRPRSMPTLLLAYQDRARRNSNQLVEARPTHKRQTRHTASTATVEPPAGFSVPLWPFNAP